MTPVVLILSRAAESGRGEREKTEQRRGRGSRRQKRRSAWELAGVAGEERLGAPAGSFRRVRLAQSAATEAVFLRRHGLLSGVRCRRSGDASQGWHLLSVCSSNGNRGSRAEQRGKQSSTTAVLGCCVSGAPGDARRIQSWRRGWWSSGLGEGSFGKRGSGVLRRGGACLRQVRAVCVRARARAWSFAGEGRVRARRVQGLRWSKQPKRSRARSQASCVRGGLAGLL